MILNNRTPKILSRYRVTKFFLPLCISLSLCFSSCDESSVVGLDVQPANDLLNVGFQDTTTLFTKTIREDSLLTDETTITAATSLLGKYIDPVFGEATASLYTELALSTNIAFNSFGANPVCDSVVIALVYDPSYYGKKERVQQTLNVYEVKEAIPDGHKYSNKTLAMDNLSPLATFNFIPRPTDSVSVLGVKQKPQLRIPLNVSFGQNLLNNPLSLSNTAAFQSFMQGLYITTENTTTLLSEQGNIMNFKLAESKMTIYYHYLSKSKGLTPPSSPNMVHTKYDFGLGSNVARFTHFTHDYSTADSKLISQLSATPPVNNDVLFIQSIAGVKTKIEMPWLMHWKDAGAISINKAELIIKTDSAYQLDTFAVPGALFIFGEEDYGFGSDPSGTKFFLPDFISFGSDYFDGKYYSSKKEYHFNITRYIQRVLDGKYKNNGLNLLAYGDVIHPNRVVIAGGKNNTSAYQMKLNITYTKLH